ncbi:hypothetical protein QVD17_40140 [Tagetes erecta]|uniref:RBR-type E3 ubiquitin transferase n=1 Tax=Tagetes erecta TaxID=13708 RepID=A0AAD8JTK4_TARER|nr:hypothetical protein QVD17_40140 [Tagetes erecta]
MLRLSSSCSHSFCSECITKHATTKIQDKNKSITCPGVNCKSTLDFNTLRQLIPKETLVKWDEFLCESMIPESHKLYCPFSKCSVLLVYNDTWNNITKVDCPVCRQTFCAACRVPWHSNLTCKEFGKREDDDVAVAFAKKKKWMRCPKCKFFVEKVDGCKRISCRCKCSFCYVCGVEWNHITHIGDICYWVKFMYS